MATEADYPVSHEASRHEVMPWARLVLSLLLLGAPALTIGMEAGRDAGLLASALEQLELDGRATESDASAAAETVVAAPPRVVGRWRDRLHNLADETQIRSRLYDSIPSLVFAHGRLVDPAFYLQRTLR